MLYFKIHLLCRKCQKLCIDCPYEESVLLLLGGHIFLLLHCTELIIQQQKQAKIISALLFNFFLYIYKIHHTKSSIRLHMHKKTTIFHIYSTFLIISVTMAFNQECPFFWDHSLPDSIYKPKLQTSPPEGVVTFGVNTFLANYS